MYWAFATAISWAQTATMNYTAAQNGLIFTNSTRNQTQGFQWQYPVDGNQTKYMQRFLAMPLEWLETAPGDFPTQYEIDMQRSGHLPGVNETFIVHLRQAPEFPTADDMRAWCVRGLFLYMTLVMGSLLLPEKRELTAVGRDRNRAMLLTMFIIPLWAVMAQIVYAVWLEFFLHMDADQPISLFDDRLCWAAFSGSLVGIVFVLWVLAAHNTMMTERAPTAREAWYCFRHDFMNFNFLAMGTMGLVWLRWQI